MVYFEHGHQSVIGESGMWSEYTMEWVTLLLLCNQDITQNVYIQILVRFFYRMFMHRLYRYNRYMYIVYTVYIQYVICS